MEAGHCLQGEDKACNNWARAPWNRECSTVVRGAMVAAREFRARKGYDGRTSGSARTSSLYLSHSGDMRRRSDSSMRMKPPTCATQQTKFPGSLRSDGMWSIRAQTGWLHSGADSTPPQLPSTQPRPGELIATVSRHSNIRQAQECRAYGT